MGLAFLHFLILITLLHGIASFSMEQKQKKSQNGQNQAQSLVLAEEKASKDEISSIIKNRNLVLGTDTGSKYFSQKMNYSVKEQKQIEKGPEQENFFQSWNQGEIAKRIQGYKYAMKKQMQPQIRPFQKYKRENIRKKIQEMNGIRKKVKQQQKGQNILQKSEIQKSRILQSTVTTQLIKNGDFSNNTCLFLFCVFTTSTFKSSYIAYWEPEPQIEVGYASFYVGTGNYKATELTGTYGTCIKQTIQNVPQGNLTLTYKYAAKTLMEIKKAQIDVYLNNTLIDHRTATNYIWNEVVVSNIPIVDSNGTYVFKMCGNASTVLYGVAVTNISLKSVVVIPASPDPTNQSNSTVNNSNSVTPTHFNFFFNFTTTNSSNQSNESNQSNQSNESNQSVVLVNPYQNQLPGYSFLQGILCPFDTTSTLFKTPASRGVISGAGSVFINLDHLWFYIYHQRNYSIYLTQIFIKIHTLETTKWDTAEQEISTYIIDVRDFDTVLDHKFKYTKPYFAFMQIKSSQFLANMYKFFVVNIPLVLVIFFASRLIHNIFAYFDLHNFFKDFSFNCFLIITLLDGNSQSFVYFLLFDIATLFQKNPTMKFINLSSVIMGFILIFLLLAGPFILRYLQLKDKEKLNYENCKDTLKGTIFFMVQFGLFNILLGSAHILTQNYLDFQLAVLFTIELCFMGFTIKNLTDKKKVFESVFKVILKLIFSFLRINLIGSLYFYQQFKQFTKNIQFHQQICVLSYLFLFSLNFLYCVLLILISTGKDIYEKIKTSKNKSKVIDERVQKIKRYSKTLGNLIEHTKNLPSPLCESKILNQNSTQISKIKQIKVKKDRNIINLTQVQEVVIKNHCNQLVAKAPIRTKISFLAKEQISRSLALMFHKRYEISKTVT